MKLKQLEKEGYRIKSTISQHNKPVKEIVILKLNGESFLSWSFKKGLESEFTQPVFIKGKKCS